MKALVLKSPGRIDLEPDWPNPGLSDGWALVRVGASGICGSDLPRIMQTGSYRHPMVPGHEFAGTVVDSRSESVRAGDRVAVLPIIPCGACEGCKLGPFQCSYYDFIGSRRDGGFAELCAAPAKNVFALPENVSDAEGAFIEPLSVALHVLRRSGMRHGARVLVFGGGAIGISVAQWAKVLGASEVVLADVRDESLEIAAACGTHKVSNVLSDEFASLGEFDNVFEAAGSGTALVSGIRMSAPRGCITIVGRDVQDTRIQTADFEKMMRKELDLRGCWGYDNRGEFDFIRECLSSNKFVLEPMITHRLALDDGPEMIEKMWNKSVFYCKAMFIIS